jgi:pSer/pThr/pTyr-binding forkhead associated (FHA) protein
MIPVIISLKSKVEYFRYSPPEGVRSIRIGRSLRCEFAIPLVELSREHSLIEFIDDDIFITDLESSNGTWVDESRIPSNKRIKINQFSSVSLSNIYSLTIIFTEMSSHTTSSAINQVQQPNFQEKNLELDFGAKKKVRSRPKNEKFDQQPTTNPKTVLTMIIAFLGICFLLYSALFSK